MGTELNERGYLEYSLDFWIIAENPRPRCKLGINRDYCGPPLSSVYNYLEFPDIWTTRLYTFKSPRLRCYRQLSGPELLGVDNWSYVLLGHPKAERRSCLSNSCRASYANNTMGSSLVVSPPRSFGTRKRGRVVTIKTTKRLQTRVFLLNAI
ncbi:hypothetical protein CPB86DRAFT_376139 [Serendipita vermifera]|nr:hypothetical protein CPB86DRAFT_376139 [Serendipita vermifera]